MTFNNIRLNKTSYLNYVFIGLNLYGDVLSNLIGVKGVPIISLGVFIIAFISYSSTERNCVVKCLTTQPVVFWLLWCVCSWLNWEIIGMKSQVENIFRFYITSFILPIITMCIIYSEGSKNLRSITLFVILVFFVYCISGIIFQDRGTGNLTDGTKYARGGLELRNNLPLTAVCLAFFSCFAFINKYIRKEYLFGLLLLALVSIFFYSTRKALGGFAIAVSFLCLAQFDFRKPKTIILFVLVVCGLYWGYDYILNHTLLGKRLSTIENDVFNVSGWVRVPSYLKFLGDRAAQYVLGWHLFLKHPINGIGLYNFQIVSGYVNRLHTEYMVQLCECGIIGFSLWFMFMRGLILTVLRSLKSKYKSPKISIVCIGGIACMLFINLTAWTYQSPRYFAIYGLILAYCQPIIISRKWKIKEILEKKYLEI